MALAKETNCEKGSPQREGVGASSRTCEQGQYELFRPDGDIWNEGHRQNPIAGELLANCGD